MDIWCVCVYAVLPIAKKMKKLFQLRRDAGWDKVAYMNCTPHIENSRTSFMLLLHLCRPFTVTRWKICRFRTRTDHCIIIVIRVDKIWTSITGMWEHLTVARPFQCVIRPEFCHCLSMAFILQSNFILTKRFPLVMQTKTLQNVHGMHGKRCDLTRPFYSVYLYETNKCVRPNPSA